MEAVGHVDATSHGELLDHLDECASCRAEAVELAQVAGTLALVDDESAELIGGSPELMVDDGRSPSPDVPITEALATGDDPSDAGPPRFRRRLVASVLAIAVATLIIVGSISLSSHGTSGSHTLTLVGSQGSRASAVLTAGRHGARRSLSAVRQSGRARSSRFR